MKTTMQRFNVIMILFLLSFQLYSSLEVNQVFNLRNTNFTKVLESDFEQLCYYELKSDLIIKNYVTRIEDQVNKIFDKNSVLSRDEIDFDFFHKVFKNGKYGQIAPELAGSEDYVRSYWNYFKTEKNSETMTEKEFTKFMGLYFLESDLLVKEQHPTLTDFFKNEHNIDNRQGCDIALAFHKLSNELLQRIFIQFKFSTKDNVTKKTIFTILTNTHTGKCMLTMDKKCPAFTNFIGKAMGFFNMSTGKRDYMTIKETKIGYSTFLFSDVYDKECTQTKFDAAMIQSKINKINLA